MMRVLVALVIAACGRTSERGPTTEAPQPAVQANQADAAELAKQTFARASTQGEAGNHAAALASFDESLHHAEAAFGAAHAEVVDRWLYRSLALHGLGRTDDAVA